MQVYPSTSPITFMTSDSPGRSRRLSMMASGGLMRLASPRARTTPPTSGDTTITLVRSNLSLMSRTMTGERHDAVDAGLGDQIGDQLGRDRRARAGFAVLSGVAEIGDHRRDAARRGAAQRIGDDQEFHQMVVGRER